MRATEIRPTSDIREDRRPMVLLCNVAALGPLYSQYGIEQRRLSGPGWAEHGVAFAFSHLKVNAPQAEIAGNGAATFLQ
jgi:hypothetical protein